MAKKCVFIFRRDLRLRDNTALIEAMKIYDEILPVFIFDHSQLKSKHKSDNFIQLQCAAVEDLANQIAACGGRLCTFYGTPYKVLAQIIEKYSPAGVAFNLDYSTYSLERDKLIRVTCEKNNVTLHFAHDVTLMPYKNIREAFSLRYHDFTKKVGRVVAAVMEIIPGKFTKINMDIEWNEPHKLYHFNPHIPVTATRKFAIERVKNGEETFIKSRDNIVAQGLMISAHLKLGLISPREVVKFAAEKWKKENCVELVRQFLWRDFYFSWAANQNTIVGIDINMPTSIYDFIDHRFRQIEWRDDQKEITAMWAGHTGVPLVDAAVRELNMTGFMHNRGRLLVGFYSVKILRINPFGEWGGQLYFSRMLIDCCYANNTGNWHWVASDILDASGQRYSKGWAGRPANPYKVSKYDPEAEYVKKWIPELKKLSTEEIENWPKLHKKLRKKYKLKYPEPIVKLSKRWKEWLDLTSR